MNTSSLRQKLHNYLEIAEDKKVKAIYALMENEIEHAILTYSAEVKEALDNRYDNFKSGKSSPVSMIESKKRIKALLKNSIKK